MKIRKRVYDVKISSDCVGLLYCNGQITNRSKKLSKFSFKTLKGFDEVIRDWLFVLEKRIFLCHLSSARRWRDLFHNITHLSFEKIGFLDDPSRFGEFIAADKTIVTLEFKFCKFGPSALQGITSNTSLRCLSIEDCILPDCYVGESFGNFLDVNPNLEKLAISSCWQKVATSSCSPVTYFIDCTTHTKFFSEIAKHFNEKTRLKYLECRPTNRVNHIPSYHFNAIIKIIRSTRFLKVFDFGDLSNFPDDQSLFHYESSRDGVIRNIGRLHTVIEEFNNTIESFGSTEWNSPELFESIKCSALRNKQMRECWESMVSFCMCFEPLLLPPYVVLEIMDWLPLVATIKHMKKITTKWRIREFYKRKQIASNETFVL